MWPEVAPDRPRNVDSAKPGTCTDRDVPAQSGMEVATVERNDPLIAELVAGKYRVLWPVARGGMARLYEVEHVGIGRRFAMKVMHPHLFERPILRSRFEREARAAARTKSPWVVDVIDLVELSDGRPAIISEWLDGEDLEARLAREETIPLPEAIAIALDVCHGLAVAHGAGVIHRDLKPANVFLNADARPIRAKILDFGVAKVDAASGANGLSEAAPLTQAGSILGTPAYMAPEQARGAEDVDARADVYGVGALLYRMRTGIPPHPLGDPGATLQRVLRDEP
ncbi:MAG: serine/threonine protein kinase, partial [Polyangiaceae bacterium]|nr:serine/threonine protein kinase [Polyangiaceae bacterium]